MREEKTKYYVIKEKAVPEVLLKVIEAKRLLTSIVTGKPDGATIADMVLAARLVDATLRSDAEKRWITL